MNNMLPFIALMSVPKSRRRRLLPLALPAAAGMPAAQAGALAVVSADSAARREGNAATAEATTAVTAVITAAVSKGAQLTVADLKHIPLAEKVLKARPDILLPSTLTEASRADLERAVAVIQTALVEGDTAKSERATKGAGLKAKALKRVTKG